MKALIVTSLRTASRFRGAMAIPLWIALTLAVAYAERGEGSDRAVIGALGSIALPILAFVVTSAALYGGSLRGAVLPLVRLGAPHLRASCLVFALPIATSAIVAAVLGVCVVRLTHAPWSPSFDAVTTGRVAALGAAAYAALFVAASSFGKRGGGRSVALALDFVIGASNGLGGLLTVRGHLRNLLGGVAPLEVGQRTSSLVLGAVVVVALGVALARLRPPPARLRRTRAADRAVAA
jgi:hypothetical protein